MPQDFYQQLSNHHLLLDSSFFADYSTYIGVFFDFVEKCKKKHDMMFITNVPVVAEFSRGSDTPDIFAQKTALVEKVIDYLLPVTPEIFTKELPWLVEKYGQMGKAVSMTDFILAAQTKQHTHDLCLVTKNPKDFPTSIFTVKTYFLLEIERGLQVYAVLCYQPTKVA